MSQVLFHTAGSDDQLRQVLELQARNKEGGADQRRLPEDGFLTVRHDPDVLIAMNKAAPHIVALTDDRVVGYALVMLLQFAPRVPVLQPMFERIASLSLPGQPLHGQRFFVMGQVCVARSFRGQGVFAGLYHCMRNHYQERYDCVVTEIATRNPRSIAAHRKVGFDLLQRYTDDAGEQWELVAWDWR